MLHPESGPCPNPSRHAAFMHACYEYAAEREDAALAIGRGLAGAGGGEAVS